MKSFDWLQDRSAGIFCHVSSLPSNQGIGCFDCNCRQFITTLSISGIKYWQICPLHPTSYGDSPYQGTSVFAGNPYFINLQELVDDGFLTKNDIAELSNVQINKVDFGFLYCSFYKILKKAFSNFTETKDFIAFVLQEAYWLEDYSMFMALKEKFSNIEWLKWPSVFKNYQTAKTHLCTIQNIEYEINFHKFVQWKFHTQWKRILQFAHEHNVEIIGDVPMFVGLDSADVWSNQTIFQLNDDLQPKFVTGVPPDAFSTTGQLWGNPVFNWLELQKTDYNWWLNRIKLSLNLYDVIRIDHFRGFYDYWSIPAGNKTAINGKWELGGGSDFFKKFSETFKNKKFIAEDLGILSTGAKNLLKQVNMPNMNVLQFAFDGNKHNIYLPYLHEKNSVLYVGTHDNNTTYGWYNDDLTESQRHQVRNYISTNGSDISWDLIRTGFESNSRLFIITIQDLLSLDSTHRFNIPGSQLNNWTWRLSEKQFQQFNNSWIPNYLKNLCETYGR